MEKKKQLSLNLQHFNGEQESRLKQIEKRQSELAEELDKEDADVDAIEKELRGLKEEKEEHEKRQRIKDELKDIQENGHERSVIETLGGNGSNNPQQNDDEKAYRKAFMNYVLRGDAIPKELRADQNTTTSEIGSVIPDTVLNRIVEKLEATGMILPLITRTSIRGGVSVPTSSVKPTATWVAEGSGSDRQKKSTGQIQFAYHKLRCAVSVSMETEMISLEIFESQLINNVVEAMVKALEQAIVSGDGSGKPEGILSGDVVTEQSLNVAELDYNTLTSAEAALPLEYEEGAVWTMTKRTFMQLMGMTDSNGQPIARINYGVDGRPERTLLGRNVVLCNYVDSFENAEAGSTFAYLFNYSDYILNTNYQMGIKKYEDNETDDFVTKSIMLADGKVVDNNSLVVLNKEDPAA